MLTRWRGEYHQQLADAVASGDAELVYATATRNIELWAQAMQQVKLALTDFAGDEHLGLWWHDTLNFAAVFGGGAARWNLDTSVPSSSSDEPHTERHDRTRTPGLSSLPTAHTPVLECGLDHPDRSTDETHRSRNTEPDTVLMTL